MLDKTINDLVRYVALKSYLDQHKDDEVVKLAVDHLRNQIKNELKLDKIRLEKINKKKNKNGV